MDPKEPPPPFASTLELRALHPTQLRAMRSKDQLFVVTSPFPYFSPKFGVIEVPMGTVSNLASIPGVVKGYLDDDSPNILYPSIVHDYLYNVVGKLPDGRVFSRQEADDLLREGMVACGARVTQAFTVYWAVRLFGGRNWKDPITGATS